MKINPMAAKIRAKKLGVLIRGVRQSLNVSLEACANLMGTTPETLQAYEYGEQSPSLPELEILAYSLRVPIDHFWGQTAFPSELLPTRQLDSAKIIGLRQKMIGVMLHQARAQAGLSYTELADAAGVAAEKLETYELGLEPIPLPELEALAAVLDLPMRDLQDRAGPVGVWFTQQRLMRDFQELPADLQAFVCKPVNRPYIELAQRLSEMSVEKLRSVAEGLLEITL